MRLLLHCRERPWLDIRTPGATQLPSKRIPSSFFSSTARFLSSWTFWSCNWAIVLSSEDVSMAPFSPLSPPVCTSEGPKEAGESSKLFSCSNPARPLVKRALWTCSTGWNDSKMQQSRAAPTLAVATTLLRRSAIFLCGLHPVTFILQPAFSFLTTWSSLTVASVKILLLEVLVQ